MRRDKFARLLEISALSKAAGELQCDAQLADRRTLQGGHIRGLVEHLLDLLGSAAAAFADAGLDPQNFGELEIGSVVAAELEGGFDRLALPRPACRCQPVLRRTGQ